MKKTKKSKAKRFELFHWVSNGGDGSATARFTVSEESAREKDDKQSETGEGWGESSVGSCILEVEDGRLYLVGDRFDGKKFVEFRNELPKARR